MRAVQAHRLLRSSLQNAGVQGRRRHHAAGLPVRCSDHIGSGKEWDMSRKRGGLRLLPPFGRQSGMGGYVSAIDALLAVEGYIRDVKQNYIYLVRGSLAVNLDLGATSWRAHLEVRRGRDGGLHPRHAGGTTHHRFVDGRERSAVTSCSSAAAALAPGRRGSGGLRHGVAATCCWTSWSAATAR
ncbi:MAG: hypothetical protein ACLTSG_04670 [Lachnospiraceae bacterium]